MSFDWGRFAACREQNIPCFHVWNSCLLSIFASWSWMPKVGHLELLTHVSFQKRRLFWVVTLPSWTLAGRTIAILFGSPSSPTLHLSLSQGRYFLRERGPLSQPRKVKFQLCIYFSRNAGLQINIYVCGVLWCSGTQTHHPQLEAVTLSRWICLSLTRL